MVGGVGTLLISREVAIHQTQSFLLRTATALAILFERVNHRFVHRFLTTAGVGHLGLVPITRTGKPLLAPPPPLTKDSVDWHLLLAGNYQSGVVGNKVFIAYPVTPPPSLRTRTLLVHPHAYALLLTRQLPSIEGPAIFVVAAVIVTAAIAVLISDRYTAHISRTLDRLVTRSNRVANGHLDDRETSEEPREAELAALDAAITSMIASLRSANEAESTYILAISHDLRTPLTSIRGFAEAIIDGAVTSPVEAAHTIEREAQRIERLINDLIALARLRASDYTLQPQLIDLNELLRHLIDAATPRAERQSLNLIGSLSDDQIIINQDPERLLQLLGNLLDNAIKYANGEVIVELRAGADEISIGIQDDGQGIPGSVKDQLFHSQLNPTPGKDGAVGSGLGLLIVGRLASHLGVEVRAGARPDRHSGTRFEVILPRVPTDRQSVTNSAGDTASGPIVEPDSNTR